MEAALRKSILANRILLGILPLLAVGGALDLWGSVSASHVPLDSIPPRLDRPGDSGLSTAPLKLSGEIFHPVKKEEPAEPATVAVEETRWQLKGVLMAAGKKAFLEDADGNSVWVQEGEQVGAYKVKQIRERSVVLEKGGQELEIRI